MQIRLDDDQWVAATDASLGDVFADLSERAHAKARIVTTMMLDRRRITDRDIEPRLLQEPSDRFSNLVATSLTQEEIIHAARGTIDRYRELVVQEGHSLVSQLRLGMRDLSLLDRWLGKVADLLELIGTNALNPAADSDVRTIAGWIEELLGARHLSDMVRMADLLEYEILPRLSL
ncbi:MAG: hypothetical protein EHM80_15850 [Nitrospiraceae bacterium]|jgi:hypothetical protein|nr:MAG: hypothetical protein EHM80_15850 [Nitrospiraceae bacterium]